MRVSVEFIGSYHSAPGYYALLFFELRELHKNGQIEYSCEVDPSFCSLFEGRVFVRSHYLPEII